MKERPLVLIVEDEYYLQADVVSILANSGFEADAVSSGEEAVKLFASGTRPYKALIADIRLGGSVCGWEVARQVRKRNRALPVIYITANAAEEWASQSVPNSILIGKPFASAQVVTALMLTCSV